MERVYVIEDWLKNSHDIPVYQDNPPNLMTKYDSIDDLFSAINHRRERVHSLMIRQTTLDKDPLGETYGIRIANPLDPWDLEHDPMLRIFFDSIDSKAICIKYRVRGITSIVRIYDLIRVHWFPDMSFTFVASGFAVKEIPTWSAYNFPEEKELNEEIANTWFSNGSR